MDITLTTAEQEMFEGLAQEGETLPDTFHRLLLPMLKEFGEHRLQSLADQYRQLTPDLQSEALQVLRVWQMGKLTAATPPVTAQPLT